MCFSGCAWPYVQDSPFLESPCDHQLWPGPAHSQIPGMKSFPLARSSMALLFLFMDKMRVGGIKRYKACNPAFSPPALIRKQRDSTLPSPREKFLCLRPKPWDVISGYPFSIAYRRDVRKYLSYKSLESQAIENTDSSIPTSKYEILLAELAFSNPMEFPLLVESNMELMDETFYKCTPILHSCYDLSKQMPDFCSSRGQNSRRQRPERGGGSAGHTRRSDRPDDLRLEPGSEGMCDTLYADAN